MSVSITRLGYANQHCILVECLLLLCFSCYHKQGIYTLTLYGKSMHMILSRSDLLSCWIPVLFVINMFHANSHFKHIVEFINQTFVKNGAWVGAWVCFAHRSSSTSWNIHPKYSDIQSWAKSEDPERTRRFRTRRLIKIPTVCHFRDTDSFPSYDNYGKEWRCPDIRIKSLYEKGQ